MYVELRKVLTRFWVQDDGQAIVEFILLLAVTIGAVIFMKNMLRDITVRIWVGLAKRIAAPCPNPNACPAGDEFDVY